MATRQTIGFLKGSRYFLTTVAFTSDGKTLASAGFHDKIVLWDAASHLPIGELGDGELSTNCVAFSPGGKTLATAGFGNTVRLWDVHNRKPLGRCWWAI